MTEQYHDRLHRLLAGLDESIKDLWRDDAGWEELIALNEWRGELAELEKDMRSEVTK